MADFSTAPSTQGTSFELIPEGVLAKGWLIVKPWNAEQGIVEKPSERGVSFFLESEVVITEGEYEKRRLFPAIMRGAKPGIGGDDAKKAERNLNMGNAQLRAILEYGANAGPHNPKGYQMPDDYAPLWRGDSPGIPVAVRIGIEKDKDGKYKDKNVVRLFLSPNPESDGHKDFLRLQKGDTGPAKPAASASSTAPAASWAKPAAPSTGAPPASPPPASTAAAPQKPSWMNGGR